MSELTLPEGAGTEDVATAIRDFVSAGDEIELDRTVTTIDEPSGIDGTVVGFADEGIELQTDPTTIEVISYDAVDHVTLLDRGG